MSRKVALLVSAEVTTRVVVEVEDDFDVENLNEFQFEKIADIAKNNLVRNLNDDYMDCITDIELDRECPYTDYKNFLTGFIIGHGIVDEFFPNVRVYVFKEDLFLPVGHLDDKIITIFLDNGKLKASYECCGYYFQEEVDEMLAEDIYHHLKEKEVITL